MSDLVPIRTALLSVSDKADLVPLARRLDSHGVKLISTGGTRRVLEEAGIPVTGVEEVTGFPEMMDGRVKTLHPRIHGGLLALRDDPEHQAALKNHDIPTIDLVCVNLYPFEKTVSKADVAEQEAIEQIDIGGPSMLRSAAKNFRFVTVVTSPNQYDQLCADMDQHGGATSLGLRRRLASAVFARTAAYDTAIATWMNKQLADGSNEIFPETMILALERQTVLRYGENPHQEGALYLEPGRMEPTVARADQLHGKELSFCNLYDANGALELVKEIDPADFAAAAVIKHANPCGFAVADQLADAFSKAYRGDPLAAFGGIVALNRPVDMATAEEIVEGDKFLEVILAPAFDPDALAGLRERWKNVRLLAVGDLAPPSRRDATEMEFKRVTGGMLVQQRDLSPMDPSSWQHVAGPDPDQTLLRQMQLAMTAVKHLKSNAVCLVRDDMLVGAGAGQMDRLASCRLALEKAGDRARESVAGSDAFFPFADGPHQLIAGGVTAIAQPGGSRRDHETVAACDSADVTLVFTGKRHFRH